ncbi:IS1 family transposase, partial [Piscirickettsia salmonis]|uniref:IS1 family transposase n=1 Tax=Piscirickettsia salmonis TaxID=1238 RepID=UPI001C54CA1D
QPRVYSCRVLLGDFASLDVQNTYRGSDAYASFNIRYYYTDDWGSYQRILPEDSHFIGKKNTQAIERKHLTLRTRIKRLARKTICFSKSEKMHDVVIGLFINKFEFGKAI